MRSKGTNVAEYSPINARPVLHCTSRPYTARLGDRFGRVPVGLRRYAGTIVILTDTAPHAYTLTTGDTHFFGDCEMNAWVHEAGESLTREKDASEVWPSMPEEYGPRCESVRGVSFLPL
ncbi:hypothetical protein DFH08DRAFT_113752 [Mycena albidolilacea]|uniref:Uncharacterized protein n=1 Tax=Mycena albidolilacea TaxID=1033008 RepID=A0AAD7A7H7_9AGAR|nr:hypothetical protein DFH08DRAFT_113752 [Mycena albidolilacea]